jgi:mutator protein MutT
MFHRIGKDGRRYNGMAGAGILFTDGERILLLKRGHGGDFGGTWAIPGGRTEKGESAIDTAVRETKEEVGLITGTRFAAFEEIDGRHRFHVYLYAVSEPFECKISKEHDDWRWIPLNDLDRYKLHPRLEEALPYYQKAIRRRFPRKDFKEWAELRAEIS